MNIENVKAALNETLPIMGMGMLGIFTVTIVIIATIWLLNTLTSKPKN